MSSSLALEYELTSLLPYTWYVISARPHTLKGEGKESEGVLTRTGEAGEYTFNHLRKTIKYGRSNRFEDIHEEAI